MNNHTVIVQRSTIRTISDCEEDFDDFFNVPGKKTSANKTESTLLVHIAQNQQINGQLRVESQRKFHHLLMSQLQVGGADRRLAGSYSAWNRTTRSSTEEQTCRRCRNAQGTSQSRTSESRRRSQVFQGYVETDFIKRAQNVSSGDFINLSKQKKRKY